MSESPQDEGNMEWKQQAQQYQVQASGPAKGVAVPSQSRSGSGREPAAKGKGQWRDKPRRGRYRPPTSQDRYPVRGAYDGRNQHGQLPRQSAASDKRHVSRSGNQYRGHREVSKASDFARSFEGPAVDAVGNGSGGKKNGNSLNYLLNFKYAPRERVVEHRVRSGSRRHTSFNKELFLQANCQFVVSDSADYTIYAVEPDLLVDWELIEQVRIFSHEVPSCPICLFPPTAAKMTRCGHVYCWPCILHYLSLSDRPWHKCPICYDAVSKNDLKSVTAMESHHYAIGQKITMRLMKRTKNSTLVLPKSQWKEREQVHFRMNDTVDTCFSKLLLASPDDIIKQVINQEEAALSVQLEEAIMDKSGEECFVESALLELQTRRKELSSKNKSVEEVSAFLSTATLKSEEEAEEVKEQSANGWNVILPESTCIESVHDYEAAFSDEEDNPIGIQDIEAWAPSDGNTDEIPGIVGSYEPSKETSSEYSSPNEALGETAETKSFEYGQASVAVTSPQESYYFYQAEDGQNIFLHPINARCLIQEYGSLENAPEFIEAEIIELEPISQTEELRKRYRYLSYLPLTCEFVMCEIDLKSPILSKATLEFFREELQKRRQKRQKKLKMENRRDKKVAMRLASLEGHPSRHPEHSINLSCDLEFPAQAGPMVLSPVASRPGPFTQLARTTGYNTDEGSSTVSVTEEAGQLQDSVWGSPPSFAQALRTGKAVEGPRPIKSASTASGVSSGGTAASDDSDEDYLPPPTFQSTFSDALSTAVGQSLDNHLAAEATGKAEGRSGKKQKKPKKKLLFTTGHMKYN